MTVFSRSTILLLCLVIFYLPNHSCRYNRRPLSRRVVENVTLCNYEEKFAEIKLQNEPSLEFKNCNLPFFGQQIIRALNYTTKSITFRRGTVTEVLISSPALEVLEVINTGLVTLKALPFLNYNLQQLTIRSSKFHQWSSSLTFLSALEKIDIAYCNFSYLSMDWFEPFPKLRVLDLAKNKLTTLDAGSELSMGSLKRFHVWGNRLERMQGFPDAFPKLEGVTLSQNRWHCDWLEKTRDAIWTMGVTLMDMDGTCRAGWDNNGGLCCRSRETVETEVPKPTPSANEYDLEMRMLAKVWNNALVRNRSVMGMQMGNSVVYLDKPLAA